MELGARRETNQPLKSGITCKVTLDRYMRGVYDRTGLATDVLVYTPAEFSAMSNRPFIQQILKEGIVAYER